MNKPKPIKPFKTVEEEAKFWDTHDITKLMKNPKTPLSKLLPLEKEKQTVLTVRLQKSVKNKLEQVAKSKGINPSTLSRMWLIEKLYEIEKHFE
ncbi:hypothetical protein A3D05_01640 [Candidatus Gottesmanbacteria bacterium RIFCSPHIGHO2_02_FULL_40_24]|uniref:CopG family transcriptional regulator n=1 Tax=Candidatus Gottesmanbacteria bacterium RIFCSPHIGHO2_01_FULL_40_15 TaxID=1798376 RepID=A0A1F5Z4B0_9BACT|nr:MAG: hypothetical protein A2777_04995 [Candidatus Gottesmanbacteria bacterium RIFCSPHIGHO2_01_FULL_40_15]OGG18562.1 MAG: hypothetical protein A3D05_01640 [Candidatus Gottesmanbacteria bacterium RIFCSPHIGHO2_02_FULL_40_24]OGG22413.1 MAG: hypothetical protein A3B48_01315 [Candidatus Gottesmanbacteria bacterium RIFCSPLOWO2_01_FULL_40_10]OGG25944.1 MAG: hypothetical protein A3E42_03870 [Candidatus Gottesmanbacteria bacterium RIFCSPHIGHO2_12_FULL_40_13]OGG32098.1 MAG: hypothetical protein A3I80_0